MLWVLETPLRGASNEYPQHMFYSQLRKITTMFGWKTPYLEFVYWIESAPGVDSKERETNIYTCICHLVPLEVSLSPNEHA